MKAYIDWFENHGWTVRIIMSILLVVHCVLNSVYMGKPVPISRIVLQPWMAYTNVVCMGAMTGLMWICTSKK